MINSNITAYILAGGQSRRLGTDKLFAEINQTNLLQKTIETCSNLFSSVKIVAKESSKFEILATSVLLDSDLADGPMAGIISSLEDCHDEFCFITAADYYDLSEAILHTIIESYRNEQYLGLKINGRLQPLCGVFHKSCLPKLKEIAKTKNYKMVDALESLDSHYVEVSFPKWRNINYSEDLEEIRRENV